MRFFTRSRHASSPYRARTCRSHDSALLCFFAVTGVREYSVTGHSHRPSVNLSNTCSVHHALLQFSYLSHEAPPRHLTRDCCTHVHRPDRSVKFNAQQSADVCTGLLYDIKSQRKPTSDHHLRQSFFRRPFATMATQQYPSRFPDLNFRVLIIGRANAGKTSILQRVCDTTESPEIYRRGPDGTRHQVCSRS